MISVLYVDDEQALLQVAQIFLERTGDFRVATALSAKIALDSHDIRSYDAIISDYQMPRMDGIAFLKIVRERFGDIPFILFTGKGREEVVIEAINNGADFYLQKGGEPEAQFAELAHKIRQVVRRRRAELDRIQSEEKFSKLFISNPSLEAITDFSTGKLIEINDAFVHTTGYTREEIIGKTTREIDLFYDYADREQMAHALTEEGIIKNFETRIRTKSGDIRTLDFTGQRLRIGDNDILFSQAVDITDRKRAEEELRHQLHGLPADKKTEQVLLESEKTFRTIFENSPYPIAINSARDFRFVAVNKAFIKSSGYSEAEVLGKTHLELGLISLKDSAKLIARFVASGNKLENVPLALTGKGGKSIHVLFSTVPATFKGRPAVLTMTVDVTQLLRVEEELLQKNQQLSTTIGRLSATEKELQENFNELRKNEQTLRASEIKFRALVENTLDGILIIDFSGHIHFVNRAVGKIVDIDDYQEIIGNRNVMEFVSPESREDVIADFRKVAGGTDSYIALYKLITERKQEIWIESIGKKIPYGNSDAIILSIRDVTERKRAEDALHESRQMLAEAMDLAHLVNWEFDVATGTFTFDDRFYAMYGTTAEREGGSQMSAETYAREFVHPDDSHMVAEEVERCIRTSDPNYTMQLEHRIIRRDGAVRYIVVRLGITKDSTGKTIKTHGANQDITERKTAEHDLRSSEQRYRAVSENAGSWIWEVDPGGVYRYSSPAVEKILGYRPDELVGKKHFYDLFDPEVRDELTDVTLAAFGRREPINTFVNINNHKNGTPVILKTSGTPLFDETGNFTGYCGVDEDITERKKAEEALRRTNHQLNLLNGITRHDILNKITIMLSLVAIAEEFCSDPKVFAYLEKMKDPVNTIRSQIEFTRIYQNIGTHEPQWLDLDAVIPNTYVPITIALNADVHGIRVFADAMLEKVFFNLLDNSVRHGERVTKITISSHKSSGDLVVVWEDNGVGIPDEDKEMIFDRGFGKNTGLGLFLVREILFLTGISITETGTPGVGARFEIVVPKGTYRLDPDRWLPQAD